MIIPMRDKRFFFRDSCGEWRSYREELSQSAGQHKHLEHVFRKHVKPKKQHEIARLSDVIRTVADGRVLNLVDVGSGLGHLYRLLSFGHGFKAGFLFSHFKRSRN